MPEEEIKTLIPKSGDRAAIRHYCEGNKKKYLKQGLLEKIKEKMSSKNKNKSTDNSSAYKQKKKTRYISIGWLCANKNGEYRHVRSAYGGGTRRVVVEKTASCNDVLAIAKGLYFPEGQCPKGPIKDFDVELLDFSRSRFTDMELTVQEIYEMSALTDLRFYLATTYKEMHIDEDEDYVPSTVTVGNQFEELPSLNMQLRSYLDEFVEEVNVYV